MAFSTVDSSRCDAARGSWRQPRFTLLLWFAVLLLVSVTDVVAASATTARDFISSEVKRHPGLTGTYVLEKGEESLLARAWLADQARRSIDVQYFIWSTDNIGILASEALLRAAERGVQVRVIVDDLLMDAPDTGLLALALHPNIDIRIYNPVHSVGVSGWKRVWNLFADFRGANQRMHDKTFIVDGELGIVGGRNMADEYFDYDHEYNFRDRDALVLGAAARTMGVSFEQFWGSALTVPVEQLHDGIALTAAETQAIYRELHRYAGAKENFAPEVHAAIDSIPDLLPSIAAQVSWGRVDFVSDAPGKNDGTQGLGGGGLTTRALADLLDSATRDVLIQSPYLVLSDAAMELFKKVRGRGVRIRIHTNSLASTDNIQAFSGYRNQRTALLRMGLEIREFRPDSQIQRQLMQRYAALEHEAPIFALHAKTMVIDDGVAFIGTYNLDPRSENLNTEVGVIIRDARQAQAIARAIEADMGIGNSWNALHDPDRYASRSKRARATFWQMMPLKPLL